VQKDKKSKKSKLGDENGILGQKLAPE